LVSHFKSYFLREHFMSVTYDLECANGHREESAFANLETYNRLKEAKLLVCGHCGAPTAKLPSAPPIVGLKGKHDSPRSPTHPKEVTFELVAVLVRVPGGSGPGGAH
jgi:hypothetical protein